MCDAKKDQRTRIPLELDRAAEHVAGHVLRGYRGGEELFVLHYLLPKLQSQGVFLGESVLDLLSESTHHDESTLDDESTLRDEIVYEAADPASVPFLRRVLEHVRGAPDAARQMRAYDASVASFTDSTEPQLFAYAVTEACPRYWPVVAEFSIPALAHKDWHLSGPAGQMKDGQRDARRVLSGLDPSSARAAAEILYFVLHPDQLAAPAMDAPWMQAYTSTALLGSDTRGLSLLLAAGMDVEQRLTIGEHSANLLSHAVMNTISMDVVVLLLDRGASARSTGPEGISLLHVAAATGELALARLLVDYGADVEATLPGTEITPVIMALSNEKMDLVEFFSSVMIEKAAVAQRVLLKPPSLGSKSPVVGKKSPLSGNVVAADGLVGKPQSAGGYDLGNTTILADIPLPGPLSSLPGALLDTLPLLEAGSKLLADTDGGSVLFVPQDAAMGRSQSSETEKVYPQSIVTDVSEGKVDIVVSQHSSASTGFLAKTCSFDPSPAYVKTLPAHEPASSTSCDSLPSQGSASGVSSDTPLAALCLVCMDAPRTHALVHGDSCHAMFCGKCSRTVIDSTMPCPFCKQPVTARVRVFSQ